VVVDLFLAVISNRHELQNDAACESLNVFKNTEKQKLAGMDVSGVVGVQCCHIMMHATVDIPLGEE
jgi:hypothetical protein